MENPDIPGGIHPDALARFPGEKLADARFRWAERRRTEFLMYVKNGETYAQASLLVGWAKKNSYQYHQKHYPLWWKQVQAAHAAHRDPDVVRNLGGSVVSSFTEYVRLYFPDRRPHTAAQLLIAEVLDSLEANDIVLLLIWPESGKTATLEDYICKKLAEDPGHRFRYVSEAGDLAKRVIGTVKRRMTDDSEYPAYIHKYGPFYEENQERNGRPWATDQIVVAKNPGHERDRNLVASSITSAVLGSRIDTLVLDDICTQRNYNQSEKIFEHVTGTFFSRGKHIKTLILGNRIGPGDFYELMIEAGMVTKIIELRAADHEGNPTFEDAWVTDMRHNRGACCGGQMPFRPCPDNGEILTPREFMELKKHRAGRMWEAIYQQRPMSDKNTSFSAYLERCLDYDRVVGQLHPTKVSA